MVKITKESNGKTVKKKKERKTRQQDYYEEDQLQRLPEAGWDPRKVQQQNGYSQDAANQDYYDQSVQYQQNQNYQSQNAEQYDQNQNYQNPQQYDQNAQYDQNQNYPAQNDQTQYYQNSEQYDQNQNYQNSKQYDQGAQYNYPNQIVQNPQIENYQSQEQYDQSSQHDQNQKYLAEINQPQNHENGYQQPEVQYLSRKGNNQRRYQVKFTPTQNNGAINLDHILNQQEYYPTQSEAPQKQEFIINYQDSQENYDYEDTAQPQALPLVSQYQNAESSQPTQNSQYSNDYQNSNQYYDGRQYDTTQQFAPPTRVVLDNGKYASLVNYPRAPNLDVTERYSPSSAVIAETASHRSSGLPETATQNVNVLYLFGRNSHYSDYPQSNNLSNPVEYEPTLRVNNYRPQNVPRSHIELNPYLLNLSFAVNPAVVRSPILLPKALPQLQFPSTFPPSPIPPTTVASDLVSTYASLFNISSDGIIADNARSGNLYGDAKVTAALNAYALSKQLLSNGTDVLTAIIGNVSYPQPTPSPLLKKKVRPPTKPQVSRFFQGLMETISNGISSLLG